MNSDTKLTKKQKKGLAFRERKGKGKARAADFEENALPVMENPDEAEAELETRVAEAGVEAGVVEVQSRDAEAASRGAKVVGESKKENKKRKRQPDEGEDGEQNTTPKKRKAKGKPVEKEGGDAETVESAETTDSAEKGKEKGKGKEKQQRFILFVGNLKYSTTKEAVQAHFAACEPPPTVRLMTPKPSAMGRPTAKSKGFAFLEFTNKQPLQTALKLHQSDLQGRMINVELTAGGGGKSDGRLKKVKERNKELFEQRKKKLEQQKGKSDTESDVKDLARPQRYSSTSGFTQTITPKRTWSIPEGGEDQPKKKKRGMKKPAPRSQGTGVNAIPVG